MGGSVGRAWRLSRAVKLLGILLNNGRHWSDIQNAHHRVNWMIVNSHYSTFLTAVKKIPDIRKEGFALLCSLRVWSVMVRKS